jgi:RNA-directed DNA polymerase
MTGTLNSGSISTRLERIANMAREHPERSFQSVHHAIDVDWLHEAHRRTRKSGAAGIDQQTAAEYEVNLRANLESLLARFREGTYRAPPVRRVHIPKGDGSKTRPIGVPTFEDKVLQRAVTMLLESIYEQDFHPSSFGFRPGRSAHDALDALWKGLTSMGGGWVLEVDIESFFDSLDHAHLRRFLDRRVTDGVVRRVIDKWLKAGVMERGEWRRAEAGTPQGGVISPLLANLYLHEVLDEWFEHVVCPRLRGRAFLVRYADDFVVVCALEEDARKVQRVLPKRFGKYGLRLHPEKTRLVRFERPHEPPTDPSTKPGTFDLLGFTHLWGRSWRGRWVIQRRTAKDRLRRSIRSVSAWCRNHRHLPVADQAAELGRKLRGHYGYFGITGNVRQLAAYYRAARAVWRKWLDRRGGRRGMSWERFARLLTRHPLPLPRVVHSIYRTAANS